MYVHGQNMALLVTFGIMYIVTSSALIAYNKYLVHEDRFPYAVALVMIHTAFCSCLTLILYCVRPRWFPSLTDPAQQVVIDRSLILRGAVPIAALFSMQLVLSNTAYLHCSVAFLQMLKEANLVLVYTLSLVAALENFSWRSAGVLVYIIAATTLTIHGEMNFSATGFTIQALSQLFEASKIVLQAMMLTNAGRKLDALTYVMLVMPFCFLFLCGLLVFLVVHPTTHFATPQLSEIVHWSPHLFANAMLAFALNVVIALFVKHSSAVAFILAGIVKDAMIVATGGLLLREVISVIQGVGFTMQLSGILLWSLLKIFPQKFENGIAAGMADLICGSKPVVGKDAQQCYGSTGSSDERVKGP